MRWHVLREMRLCSGTPTGVDGVRPRHRNPGAAPNEYAYSAAAVAASRRNGYSGVPAPLSQPKPVCRYEALRA